MIPSTPTQSKYNLLRASLAQLKDSDLFSEAEKTKLIASINEQIKQLNHNQPEPTAQ